METNSRILVDYGNETEAPTDDEVYEEFGRVAEKAGIKEWMGKQVERKYAFELPDVPQESSYLKVLYSFDRELASDSVRIGRHLIDYTSYRTATSARYFRRDLQPYLWNKHKRFRAVCAQAEDNGTLLAEYRRTRIQRQCSKCFKRI